MRASVKSPLARVRACNGHDDCSRCEGGFFFIFFFTNMTRPSVYYRASYRTRVHGEETFFDAAVTCSKNAQPCDRRRVEFPRRNRAPAGHLLFGHLSRRDKDVVVAPSSPSHALYCHRLCCAIHYSTIVYLSLCGKMRLVGLPPLTTGALTVFQVRMPRTRAASPEIETYVHLVFVL